MIEAYFDGACEPINPGGYAGAGAVILINNESVWKYSKLFDPKKLNGRTSNNTAEYSAFNAILKELLRRKLHTEEVTIYGDSQLVIYQHSIDPRYKKKWRILKGLYVPLAREAESLVGQFTRLNLTWIPREENSIADELSKAELVKAGVTFKIQPVS